MSGLVPFTVKDLRKAPPAGPLEALESENENGHRRVVLPDLLTPTGVLGSVVLFVSHNISHSDSVH